MLLHIEVWPPGGHRRALPCLVAQPAHRVGQRGRGPEDRAVGRQTGQELSGHAGL